MSVQQIIAWVVVFFLCAPLPSLQGMVGASAALPSREAQSPPAALPDFPLTPYSALAYERPDGDAFVRRIEALTRAVSGDSTWPWLLSAIDEVGAMVDEMYTMDALLIIEWGTQREYRRMYRMLGAVSDAVRAFIHAVYDTAFGEALVAERPHFFAGWTLVAPGKETLRLREAEQALVEDIAAFRVGATVDMRGEAMGYDEINALEDDRAWERAMWKWYRAHYDELMGMYVDLVRLRTALAQAQGYDSYAALRFDEMGKGYTPEMAQALLDEIMEDFVPAYEETYWRNRYKTRRFAPDFEAFMQAASPLLHSLSPWFGMVFDRMHANGLCHMNPDIDYVFGVTYFLPMYDQPIIDLSYRSGLIGMNTVIHEFGHFYENYLLGEETTQNLDVAEVHSQAMELLFANRMPALDPVEGSYMREETVRYTIDNLMDQAFSTAIELALYQLPEEEMTVERFEAVGRDIYGRMGFITGAYGHEPREWLMESDVLDEPLYAFCYAVSTVVALDIWLLSLEDEAAAVASYQAIVDAQPAGVIEAAAAGGYASPFAPGRMRALVLEIDALGLLD